jgi:hypothetical protein
MKTNIIRIAAAIVLSAATLVSPSYASDKKPKKTDKSTSNIAWSQIEPVGNEKKVAVSFGAHDSDRPASIQILNEAKEVVYRDYIKHPHTFRKVYDLSQLGEGIYTLQIVTGRPEAEKTFALTDMLHKDELRVIFLAGSDHKHFRFGMENLTKADAALRVKDSAGNVVYKENLNNISKKVIEKDFSYLNAGEYTVEVASAKGEFSKKMIVP